MIPSRRILTPFIDYPNIFLLWIAGRPDSKNLFEYTIRPNYDSQEVFFDIKFLDYLKGERFRIDVQENDIINRQLLPLYDENRNLLIQNDRGYVSYLGHEMNDVCFVGERTR